MSIKLVLFTTFWHWPLTKQMSMLEISMQQAKGLFPSQDS